jgi:predicted nucleic acid-binding protein
LKSKGLIIDTCVWIDFFKPRSSELKQTVGELLSREKVYLCGPVLYELSQGIRSEKEKALLADGFSALCYLEIDKPLWLKAGTLSASLNKIGKTIPLSDILIAILALEHDLSVLTEDRHFNQIPGLKLYPLEPQ